MNLSTVSAASLKSFVGVLLLGLYSTASAASELPETVKLMALKGLERGCESDLRVLHSRAEQHAETSQRGSSPADTNQTSALDDVARRLSSCHDRVMSQCGVDRAYVENLVGTKAKFLTGETSPAEFEWNEKTKQTIADATARKVCSGAISLETLQEIDSVLAFNTRCTGQKYLMHLERFKSVRGIQEVKAQDQCDLYGRANTTTLNAEENGTAKTLASKYLILGSSAVWGWASDASNVVSVLDDTLIHEFAHHTRGMNPRFRAETDQFLRIRYRSSKAVFSNILREAELRVVDEAARLSSRPELENAEKQTAIDRFTTAELYVVAQEARMNNVPIRAIEDLNSERYSSGLVPSRRTTANGLVQFHDGVVNRINTGAFQILSWSMFSEEEYLAIALSMYRLEPERAASQYSVDELAWLDSSWKNGFLMRQP